LRPRRLIGDTELALGVTAQSLDIMIADMLRTWPASFVRT